MLRNNEKHSILYKNQLETFKDNITLENRKSTLYNLYTLQKSTSETTLHSRIGKLHFKVYIHYKNEGETMLHTRYYKNRVITGG